MTGGDGAQTSPATLYTLSLGFAPNGNVTSASDNGIVGTWTYAYDDFNRLTTSTGPSSYTYTYDRYGNRPLQESPNGFNMLLSFDDSNHIIVDPNCTSAAQYCHDAAGNLLNDGAGRIFQYDAENRIIAVTGAALANYVYNADGQRVRAIGNGVATDFVYDNDGHRIHDLQGGSIMRSELYTGSRHVGTYSGGMLTYSHTDWLQTERVRSDSLGNSIERCSSLPFGDGMSCSGSDASPNHFTGKERDTETGLDYFGIRYYGSNMGRFVSPDSVANDWELVNPQTWNRYAYARNNPPIFVDPDGAAVELFQRTDKEREKALTELQKDVGNKEAASRLYINEVEDGDKTRYFVGIKGDVGEFMKLSSTAHDLANLVQDKQVVEFGLTKNDLSYWGGAITYDKGEAGNQNVRVLVNPQQAETVADTSLGSTILGQSKYAGQFGQHPWRIRSMTGAIAEWHEFGHAWGSIHGRPAPRSNKEANAWENRMREQVYGPLGPNNAQRERH